MALESPATIELTEQRAELERVLESRGFVRAPTLSNLLSYLCEKLFAGEASQIKEYSIGVEVFHRGESFDQDADSIVRVEANRLRKRLAEYYSGDGSANPLQISIPLGQYVPRFGRNPASSGTNLAKPDEHQVKGGSPKPAHSRPAARYGWWTGTVLGFLLVALAVVWYFSRQQKPVPTTAEVNPAAGVPSDFLVGPPGGEEVRILAGAGRSFVDHADKLWSADKWFTGGTEVKSSVQHVGRTLDPIFYRTSRQGQFRYDIPLHKGVYELRLHFAETVYGPESTGSGGEGSRIMTVRVNGEPLLTGFDVVADAGAGSTADVKVFPDITPATDAKLHLDFAAEEGQQAILSAIEILPGISGRIRPVRILARQTPYYSNDSRWWSPDDYFEGGQIASYPTPVNGTDDPEFYETERWGNFSYAIPVSRGKYTATLFFAVRHGNWDEPSSAGLEGKAEVAHVFNVFCNGRTLLSNFDLAKEARSSDVVIRRFTDLQPNAQGKLLLSFVPVQGYATVTGIEVLPE